MRNTLGLVLGLWLAVGHALAEFHSPPGVPKGSIILDVKMTSVFGGAQDMKDLYGSGLSISGRGRILGFGLGANYAISRRIEIGAAWERRHKKNEVRGLWPGGEIWDVPAQRISLRGRWYLSSGRSFLSGSGKDRLHHVVLVGSIGRMSLSGASYRAPAFSESLDLTGSGLSGSIELGFESAVTSWLAPYVFFGYEFGKTQPILREGGVFEQRGTIYIFREGRVLTHDGEDAYFSYSGIMIGLSLRVYVGGNRSIGAALPRSVVAVNDSRRGHGTAKSRPVSAASSPGEVAYRASVPLYNAGDYDGAWAKAYEAIRVDSKHWQSWQMIGNCQYAKGERKGALESYRHSLAIHPDNPTLRAFVKSMANP